MPYHSWHAVNRDYDGGADSGAASNREAALDDAHSGLRLMIEP